MRTLIVLTALFGALSAASLHPPDPLSVACDDQGAEASRAALHHINAHHHRGYKYRLSKTRSSNVVKKNVSSCEFQLELDLEETNCHVVNPKHFDKCEVRPREETKVKSECNVTLTVAEGKAEIKKYSCTSAPASAEELAAICPDCPFLLPLHDPHGLDSIKQALKKFHQESNGTSFFKLMEVGRFSTQYMYLGQSYFAEFAIVETSCSRGADPEKEKTCQPLCDGNARHGFCSSTLLGNNEVYVDCEIYDAQNVTDEGHYHHRHNDRGGPDGKPCGHHDHPGHHTRPAGRPAHGHPPPFPPPPDHPQKVLVPFPHCPGQPKIPPSIHPICPPPPFHTHPLSQAPNRPLSPPRGPPVSAA